MIVKKSKILSMAMCECVWFKLKLKPENLSQLAPCENIWNNTQPFLILRFYMFSLCVRVLYGSTAFGLKTTDQRSSAQTTVSAGDSVTEKKFILASCTTSSRRHRVVQAFVFLLFLQLYKLCGQLWIVQRLTGSPSVPRSAEGCRVNTCPHGNADIRLAARKYRYTSTCSDC